MNKIISIIPEPQSITVSNGILFTENGYNLCTTEEFKDYAKFLAEQVSSTGVKCAVNSKDENLCTIAVIFSKNLPQEEAYTLEINDSGVFISASDRSGALFGIQTLKQLIMSNDGFIPCLTVEDWPEFKWRGFMLDTSRFFFSVDFIKKVLDAASFHKLNRFHWHLTDDQGWRFNVPKYPLLAKTGSRRLAHAAVHIDDPYNDFRKCRDYFYTDAMIKEVVAYAAMRNITIVPEVELPGHASALLASYPEFGCTGGPYKVENRWGIFKDVICAGNEKIFNLYTEAFKTIVRLFPGKWIHIGGDECPKDRWNKCPKCQALIKKLKLDSEKQLQSWITKKMTEIVISMGKTPVGWDEVLDNTEKCPLPKDVIVQSWRQKGGGQKAVETKHYAIISPVNKCYLNYKNYNSYEEPGKLDTTTVKKAYSFTPIEEDFGADAKKYVLGAECNMWTEDVAASKLAEYMMFPRFCALSECMWLPPEKKNFTRFKKSLEAHKARLDAMDILYYTGKLE